MIPGRHELFEESLHNEESSGWYFGAGNPESWHFQEHLLIPGGKLLDVGIGTGRSSLFFALSGMQVVGYDINKEALETVKELAESLYPALSLDYDLRHRHFLDDADIDNEVFDTVILDHLFNHQSSKTEALTMLDKAYAKLVDGGCIFVRAVGKQDYGYWELLSQAEIGYTWVNNIAVASVTKIDEDVIEHLCGCSGENRMEPSLFFNQTDLLRWSVEHRARIIHSQCLPIEGRYNMMYGEDFNRDRYQPLSGIVTIIAQKPYPTTRSY